jgi:hypothetical protein
MEFNAQADDLADLGLTDSTNLTYFWPSARVLSQADGETQRTELAAVFNPQSLKQTA